MWVFWTLLHWIMCQHWNLNFNHVIVLKRHCSNALCKVSSWQILLNSNAIPIPFTTTTFMSVFRKSQAIIKSVSTQALLWVTETKIPNTAQYIKTESSHNWTRVHHISLYIHLKFFHTHNSLAKLRICHTMPRAHTNCSLSAFVLMFFSSASRSQWSQ